MKKRENRTCRFDDICYRIIVIFFRSIGSIPRPFAQFLGKAVGEIWYRTDPNRRNVTLDNLSQAYQQPKDAPKIRRLARAIYHNIGQILFEIGWAAQIDASELDGHFRISGLSNLQTAVNKGKGVLILTAHIGNWELLQVTAAMMNGSHAHVIYRPLDFAPLNRYINELRTRYGSKLIPKSHAMRPMLRALRAGEQVVIFPDQSVDWYDGVFVDFFGRTTCTTNGAALIALKTGAPVVTTFLVRTPDGFLAEIGPEIPLVRTGEKIHDVEATTQRFNDAIEAFIRRYPEQWFWVHRRWKTRNYCLWPGQER